MRPAVTALLPLLLAWLAQAPAPPPAAEDDVRAVVQQYYDAQAQRDPDKAASFWSASAQMRPGREAFLTMFGEPAEDTITVEIRAIEIHGADARVRVGASRTRLIMRDGRPLTQRAFFINSQLWRKEAAGWKLLRDGPFAEEIADDLIAAPAADRAALIEKNRADLVQARLAISQRATMAVTLGHDYKRGKALFELALEVSRAARDRRGETNSLHNIGQAAFFLRDFPAAVEAYEQELAVAREVDDQDAAAGALFGLGTVRYTEAEYTAALGRYTDALAIYEKRDDPSAIGRTLVSIGNIQYLQAEYDTASASYRRGLALLIAGHDPGGAMFARRGLGRVLAAQGDIPAALDMYGQVLAGARAELQADPRLKSNVGAALESLGELYYRLGNTDQARKAYEEAKGLSEGDPESAGRVLSALGVTELVAGRFEAASAAYSDSRARFETAKNPEGVARAWVGIGFSQTAREKFADAVTAYRTAVRLFESQHNNDGSARAWLGLSMAQSGAADHTAALASAAKVIVIAAGIKSDDLAWRGEVRGGEALRKLERLDDARQAFERAIVSIDRLAADAPVNTEARGNLNDSASAFAGLALTLARQGDAPGALRALEMRRAHIRRVDFAAFQHDIARGATAEELADEQGIVREIISTRAQLRAEAQAAHSDPARSARLGQQLEALASRRAEQQQRLYARVPELRLWRGLSQPPVDAASLPDLVPGATGLLVDYLVTDDELLIVTVARGENGPDISAVTTTIGRRPFADTLAAAMQPAALQDAAEWRTRAAPLTAALLDPIAARLAGRDRIVFVPDDLLWKIPLEALPLGDGDLAARAGVTYATSLATLSLQRRAAAAAAAPAHPVPAFLAAPAIPDAIRAQQLLALPAWKPQDATASLAAAQAAAVAYGEGTAVKSAADATEAAARALLGAADVFHVQAPLQVSGATPLLSSVILAGSGSGSGDGAAEDGRLEARDWFALTGRARLAVLPDGSAFGAAGVGNAMDAMAWAAAAAGVSTLMLGRWPAEAFAADPLVAAFHAKIAAGMAPADAWRAALIEARQTNAAPSAWAGLRLIGAGS